MAASNDIWIKCEERYVARGDRELGLVDVPAATEVQGDLIVGEIVGSLGE